MNCFAEWIWCGKDMQYLCVGTLRVATIAREFDNKYAVETYLRESQTLDWKYASAFFTDRKLPAPHLFV